MKHFAGHEEEVHERIHADKKADRVEDEIRHEHKAAEDKAYHEMKAEKASWEEDMKVGEKSMRRQRNSALLAQRIPRISKPAQSAGWCVFSHEPADCAGFRHPLASLTRPSYSSGALAPAAVLALAAVPPIAAFSCGTSPWARAGALRALH